MLDYFDVHDGQRSITPGLLQNATKISKSHLQQDKFQSEITKEELERIYKALEVEAGAETHAKQKYLSTDYYVTVDQSELRLI